MNNKSDKLTLLSAIFSLLGFDVDYINYSIVKMENKDNTEDNILFNTYIILYLLKKIKENGDVLYGNFSLKILKNSIYIEYEMPEEKDLEKDIITFDKLIPEEYYE